jgi:hypothetical protein
MPSANSLLPNSTIGRVPSSPSVGLTEMRKWLVLAAFLLTSAQQVEAACTWNFECDKWGNCRQVPLCDSTLDIVPPRPPALAPIPPPAVAPDQRPTIPPLGTSSCRQAYICNSWGSCSFQTVCS